MPISALQPQPLSPASLYSNYSYYPPERINPSPQSSNFHLTPQPLTPQSSSSRNTPSPTHPTTNEHGEITDPHTPQDYLQLGIKHHLANRLKESASCFEKSATLNGGCGVGMLMWGLALRHGWGCEKDEIKGFKWLRRAAELAVEDLEGARGGVDTSAVKVRFTSELVLAIYEVGQSFFRGWGVEKDKQMGVSYFRVAARLGDPDAQQELAFCLANGKGCKKDRKEAAKWYREAVAQGASDIGLAWIYKEKFQ
ncbi:hypothetical protein C8Q75DRAFT_715540 [Abortiporus biennis]|nr:hypothetical protein C8Q75DRAFT_715540 [Abortiporus biennis]